MQLTILDRVINNSKTLETLFTTALLNGIGITDDMAENVVLSFPTDFIQIVPIVIKKQTELGITGIAIIKKFQKPTDFITQNAGTLEALFEIAILNGIGITDEIEAGKSLLVNVVNAEVVAFYKNAVFDIITNDEKLKAATPGGIDYMQIEKTFIVS